MSTLCLLEAGRSRQRRLVQRSAPRTSWPASCAASLPGAPSTIQSPPGRARCCLPVLLRARPFHRDHRDHNASFPTRSIPAQNALHLKPLACLRTLPLAARPRTAGPSLSRMYPVPIALKLTTPRLK
ncbi:hypothetical protein SVAN01_09349 [Stagonosporopsis vannaccii]|nr:hypothetical protein SVAN01_09349 [Stagonosporopsis vannaccii]